jgi:hypothetical protein
MNSGKDVVKQELLYTVGGNANKYHCKKQDGDTLKN